MLWPAYWKLAERSAENECNNKLHIAAAVGKACATVRVTSKLIFGNKTSDPSGLSLASREGEFKALGLTWVMLRAFVDKRRVSFETKRSGLVIENRAIRASWDNASI